MSNYRRFMVFQGPNEIQDGYTFERRGGSLNALFKVIMHMIASILNKVRQCKEDDIVKDGNSDDDDDDDGGGGGNVTKSFYFRRTRQTTYLST